MSQRTRKSASGPRPQSAKPDDSLSAKAPKQSQRERILNAMIALAAEEGYLAVSIAQVSARAGVSSATFYEQFDGKEDCMLAAYRVITDRAFEQMQAVAVGQMDSSEAARATLAALMRGMRDDPNGGRVVFIEAQAGGPLVREERKRVLGEFERRSQRLLDGAPDDERMLDIPVTAVIGGARSIVARCLRANSEDELPLLVDDMVSWLESYAVPRTKARWSTGPKALFPADYRPAPTAGTEPPARLPRGRHGLPAGVVARSQRTRIINGTAEVMRSKGFAEATVADIVAQAGIARYVFYEHFTDKQDAFLEAMQHPTQYILDTCAAAYFAPATWPERVWSGFHALLGLIVANPAMSHLRLVECYAAGPAAIRRAEEITRSFTIFLEEGYGYRPEARDLPRLYSQAIAGTIFEVIQRYITRGEGDELMRHLPQLTYVAIAPFTGAEEAIRLVEEMTARELAGD
jgi:AcrR family transcriptional regulator